MKRPRYTYTSQNTLLTLIITITVVAVTLSLYSWYIFLTSALCSPFQVNVTVDYIRAATGPGEGTPAFPERTCATVTIGGM